MANLSSLARSPVTRDYRGQIEHIGDREAPTRMVKVIMQIWRACGVIGMTMVQAWEVIWRLSIGSIPKLRRKSRRSCSRRRLGHHNRQTRLRSTSAAWAGPNERDGS
jgi:hypothetical protein